MDCHGWDFHGHGGDRLTVENCVTCHNPDQIDPHSGESLDMKVMIHKIHAGGELATIPGADGIVWDDPDTLADESADNGEYSIWGYRNSKHEWWKAKFPAVLENCTKCHQGDLDDVDNWKEVMSRDTCGSCHDDINWVTGIGHDGGSMEDDNDCGLCHRTNGIAASVMEGHEWQTKDPRNIPEFNVAMSVSTPANGTHFVAGESPVVSVVISDASTGTAIDHTTVVGRSSPSALGCTPAGCPAWDGLFYHAYLFVSGPRALRNPVLTTAARVEVTSTSAGPFDISAAGATLDIMVDNGQDIRTSKDGGTILAGDVSVDVADGTFADTSAATGAEIVAWLNADDAFAARLIAYIDDSGMTAVRSRNLGRFFSLELAAGDVNTAVFGGNTDTQVVGGYYPSNRLEDAATDDPKAVRSVDKITYTLDPVDDLAPGTYIASTEIAGLGRVSGSDYRTPSVAKVSFQVGQAAEEAAVAGNCDSCHQGADGEGFILDFARHNKMFDDAAVDQCGACHDYQNGRATGEYWGGKPISKRVHAVHYGSELNYPNLTVDYNTGDGHNWDITFTQNILNCETCHPADNSSGSWKTMASRLPCMGCHDSDAASSHMKLQTYDPTPANPWNGDEEESCNTCH
jgi:hypothetical protein